MKEFRGTPGPWEVNEIGQHWNNESLTHLEVTFGSNGECICDTVYKIEDATLIAAAPDLLEQLQWAVDELKDWIDSELEGTYAHQAALSVLDKPNAAIARALGEKQ